MAEAEESHTTQPRWQLAAAALLVVALAIKLGLTVSAIVFIGSIVFILRFPNKAVPLHPAHCCQACGYDLTGIMHERAARCPECGEGFDVAFIAAAKS